MDSRGAHHPDPGQLVELAKKLGITVGVSAETAAEAVLGALHNAESHFKWILVFDNAERRTCSQLAATGW